MNFTNLFFIIFLSLGLISCSKQSYNEKDNVEFIKSCLPIAESNRGDIGRRMIKVLGADKICDCAWTKVVAEIEYTEYKEKGIGIMILGGLYSCSMVFADEIDRFNSE